MMVNPSITGHGRIPKNRHELGDFPDHGIEPFDLERW